MARRTITERTIERFGRIAWDLHDLSVRLKEEGYAPEAGAIDEASHICKFISNSIEIKKGA